MNRRPALWFVAVFVLSLGATFPMKLAAGWAAGVTARDGEGSIWAGRLVDLRVAGLELGSPDAFAMPVSLPGGEPVLSLRWSGEGGLRGRAAVSTRGVRIDRLNGVVDPGGALPLDGIALQDLSVSARGGRCGHAAGTIRARISDGAAAPLAGTPRCEGKGLLVPLRGSGHALNLRISGSAYAAELRGPAGLLARSSGRLDGGAD